MKDFNIEPSALDSGVFDSDTLVGLGYKKTDKKQEENEVWERKNGRQILLFNPTKKSISFPGTHCASFFKI